MRVGVWGLDLNAEGSGVEGSDLRALGSGVEA